MLLTPHGGPLWKWSFCEITDRREPLEIRSTALGQRDPGSSVRSHRTHNKTSL